MTLNLISTRPGLSPPPQQPKTAKLGSQQNHRLWLCMISHGKSNENILCVRRGRCIHASCCQVQRDDDDEIVAGGTTLLGAQSILPAVRADG